MAPRRSPRLLRKYGSEEIATPSVHPTSGTQASERSKRAGANSGTGRRTSLEVAMIRKEKISDTSGHFTPRTSSSTAAAAITEKNGRKRKATRNVATPSRASNEGRPRYRALMMRASYRGVSRTPSGLYEVNVWDNNKSIFLGAYGEEDEAARAYDLAALKLWGPSSSLNFPRSRYTDNLKEMEQMSKSVYFASIKRESKSFAKTSSKFIGVSRKKGDRKWEARLGMGKRGVGRTLYIGSFVDEMEAARAVDIAAIRLKGPQAETNFEISNYDVESILNTGEIPIGEGASKRIKQSHAEDVEIWRAGSDIDEKGRRPSKGKQPTAPAVSYETSEEADSEESQPQSDDDTEVDSDAIISLDSNDSSNPDESSSSEESVKVPHSLIDLNIDLNEPLPCDGFSEPEQYAVGGLPMPSDPQGNSLQGEYAVGDLPPPANPNGDSLSDEYAAVGDLPAPANPNGDSLSDEYVAVGDLPAPANPNGDSLSDEYAAVDDLPVPPNPHGDSLHEEFAVGNLELSFGLHDPNPMELVLGPSMIPENPDGQNSEFVLEDFEGITSWCDPNNLMTDDPMIPYGTDVGEFMPELIPDGADAGEYIPELIPDGADTKEYIPELIPDENVPDGNIPDVDWDEVMLGKDIFKEASDKTAEKSNKNSKQGKGPYHGESPEVDVKSTLVAPGGNAMMETVKAADGKTVNPACTEADGETVNPACTEADGGTDNSLNGIGSLFPGPGVDDDAIAGW